ncbi:MAG: PrgI family protein [Flaviflexus sp.]|uniref:PrgI family protein n=1 Tax=Flaviflexus sp. TaxID=1969482 RepID=UPI003F9087F2
MALEVKVYREVTQYQPKVLFGMSWRQFGIAALGLPVLAAIYAGFYLLGLDDLGVLVVCLLGVPAAALGWWRPMGVPFEKYWGYMWAFRQGRKRYLYRQTPTTSEGQDHGQIAPQSRKARRAFAAFEATN